MWGQSNHSKLAWKKVETTNVLDTNRQFLTGCFCHWLIKNRPPIRQIEILLASNTINQIIYQVDCEVKTDVSLDHTFAHWTALCRTLLSGNNMSIFLIAYQLQQWLNISSEKRPRFEPRFETRFKLRFKLWFKGLKLPHKLSF